MPVARISGQVISTLARTFAVERIIVHALSTINNVINVLILSFYTKNDALSITFE